MPEPDRFVIANPQNKRTAEGWAYVLRDMGLTVEVSLDRYCPEGGVYVVDPATIRQAIDMTLGEQSGEPGGRS